MMSISHKLLLSILMQKSYDPKQAHIIIHKSTNYALQSSDDSIVKQATVEMGPVNQANLRQLWLIDQQEKDKYEIVCGIIDLVLGEKEGKPTLKRGSGSKRQKWVLLFVGAGVFKICMHKERDHYLCLRGIQIKILKVNDEEADTWQIQPVTQNELLKNSCFIRSSDCHKLIDVPQSSKSPGTHILIYTPNYRFNQRWVIHRAGEVYVIKSLINGLNLDVKGQEYKQGVEIIQYGSNGNINQFWRFEKVKDGKERQNRIYCWFDDELELGHDGKELVISRGRKFTWIIQGHFPEFVCQEKQE